MCGRLAQTMDPFHLAERFEAQVAIEASPQPRYNLAPGQTAMVVIGGEGGEGGEGGDERFVKTMRWGLVPSWAKDEKIGNKMINARAETVAQKTSFKGPLRRKRCLVPATGFFEWQKKPRKSPWFFRPVSGKTFAFAGLWDRWHGAEADNEPALETFTIITTTANDLVGRIHNRMPVILGREAVSKWLDGSLVEPDDLTPLLISYPSAEMAAHRVSADVNSTTNDGPELIEPVEDKPEEPTLF